MQGSTTYGDGSVTTRTSGAGAGFVPDRDLLSAIIASRLGGGGGGGAVMAPAPAAYSRPAVFTPDNRAERSNASMRYAEDPRGNLAALEDMDVKAGDLQKTGAQRITDRAARKRAILGIPSGDVVQGPHNADNLSAAQHVGPGDQNSVTAQNTRASYMMAPDSAAMRTAVARNLAGWYGNQG